VDYLMIVCVMRECVDYLMIVCGWDDESVVDFL